MAVRGRKPKPPLLRLITATPGKKRPPPDIEVDPDFSNGLMPPKKLRKRQAELWSAFIQKCAWLTHLDTPRAFMWVHLHERFERAPEEMNAAMISQLRALGSELGLDPSSRARISTALSEQPGGDLAATSAKYFR